MANVVLQANNYTEAERYIDFAKDNGSELMQPQISIVEARLQAQNAQYDQALATLDSITSDAYKAEILEVRGDIFMAQDKTDEAHDAYLQAINLLKDAKLQISPMLQMKFDNVIQPGDTPAYKIMAEQAQEAAATLRLITSFSQVIPQLIRSWPSKLKRPLLPYSRHPKRPLQLRKISKRKSSGQLFCFCFIGSISLF